jgi:hypothetical protein
MSLGSIVFGPKVWQKIVVWENVVGEAAHLIAARKQSERESVWRQDSSFRGCPCHLLHSALNLSLD